MNGHDSAMLKGRRALTTQHMDRYIFCLNKVILYNFIPLIDLAKEIKTDLEAKYKYAIDKKTLRRILSHLEAEGLLCIKEIKVTISYGQLYGYESDGKAE